jgi:distribution and morphology protein 34
MRHPQAPTSSLHRSNTAGPGPSSLRRHVTSRSDVFTTLPYQPARSETFAALPTPKSSHTQRSALSPRQSATAASSSAARTSGSSWETDKGPTRSGTMSTLASSQLPSSKSMSVLSKTPPRETGQHARAPSYAGTSPGTRHLGPGGITLPLNNSVSQLATLSHSNHTLSPYARGHEHIAVRSFPHLGRPSATGSGSSGGGPSLVGSAMAEAGRGRIKARRKRIYHLGSKPAQVDEPLISPDLEEPLRSASEWDEASYQHRRSFGSASGSDEVPRPLLGLAQRVMLSPSGTG